jgi:hypothetical protein
LIVLNQQYVLSPISRDNAFLIQLNVGREGPGECRRWRDRARNNRGREKS